METTKMTVEYLIIGIIVSLALIFVVFNVSPADIQALWSTLIQGSSLTSTIIIAMMLPISYGIGVVVEYLGLLMYEVRLRKIKENRFPKYIEQNLEWLEKSPLLVKYVRLHPSIPKDSGDKMYGEMRYFALMKNPVLYADIESQINQARVLRVLTIAEILVIIGLVIGFFTRGIGLFSMILFGLDITFLIINYFAVINRLTRYCRAIERSFKVLTLTEISVKTRK